MFAGLRVSGPSNVADTLPPAQVVQLLAERKGMLEAELAHARSAPLHPGPLQLLIEHSVVHLESELHWLDRVTAYFAARTGDSPGTEERAS